MILCQNEVVEEIKRREEINGEDEDRRLNATEIHSRKKPSILHGVCCSVVVGLREGIEENAGQHDKDGEMECNPTKSVKDFEIAKQLRGVFEGNKMCQANPFIRAGC